MTDERKLELTLCDQSPYKVRVWDRIMKRSKIVNMGQGSSTHWIGIRAVLNYSELGKDIYKPILHDLSSLTEEITIGGETFRMIDKLAESVLKRQVDLDKSDDIAKWIQVIIANEGIEGLQSFLVDLLNEHHFNTRGLSPDQFINVKDLEQNPY